jgi:hypothetical protein
LFLPPEQLAWKYVSIEREEVARFIDVVVVVVRRRERKEYQKNKNSTGTNSYRRGGLK